MKRKDCENNDQARRRPAARPNAAVSWPMVAGVMVFVFTACATAGTVRLWPSAVIVDDDVRLADLCDLSGLDPETEKKLADLVVISAPSPGGSRLVHLELVRSVLAAGGANLAEITLSGATQCGVTRPSLTRSETKAAHANVGAGAPRPRSPAASPVGRRASDATLKAAVIDFFDRELRRFTGRADVVFDRTGRQVLDLSGPEFQFSVRRRGGRSLGLIQLEVDVLKGDRHVQTVPLVVNLSMVRAVAVARRGINQGAVIGESAVELVDLAFTRLDRRGIGRVGEVIGQRAKRYIAAGSRIDGTMLEAVPLVRRGQLITLVSVAGVVRVVTSAKALRDGAYGDVVPVRSVDNKKVELDGTVVGPGTVEVGGTGAVPRGSAVAIGGGR